MRRYGSTGLLVLVLAACGDSGMTSDGAAASASSDTGASAATGTTSASGDTPTTSAADGSHSASASHTGDASTSTTTQASDSADTTVDTTADPGTTQSTDPGTTQSTDTASTGPISASDSDTSSTGPDCIDECDDGVIACVGDSALHSCGVGDLGCLAWSEPTPCDADETCIDGACVVPPDLCLDDCVWTKQTINANVDLYSVWGSGAKAVWTVGASGTALYYNGNTWKAVDTGVGQRLDCVHGSAADDVYAISSVGQVIRWDGAEWAAHVDLGLFANQAGCVSVLGKQDLMAIVWSSGLEELQLHHIKNGVATKLATQSQWISGPAGSKPPTISLRAFSPTSVFIAADRAYRLNNGDLTDMVAPNPSFGLWSLAPELIYNAASHSGIGHRWDGNTWKIVNPGLGGFLHMFGGTAKDRVFGVGETKVGAVAAIVAFDGIGWVPTATPADAKALFATWAAPTGEVFAVGKAGTILIGK